MTSSAAPFPDSGERILPTAEDMRAFGGELGAALAAGDLVILDGPLGAGKTTLTQGIAAGMNVRGRVTSPTFTIVNEYEGRTPLFHFDMYRLGSSDELFDIGWDDYLARGGVCAVEWSERVSDALPGDTIFVDIARTDEHEDWRTITVTGVRFA